MLVKEFLILNILFTSCLTQNILNLLDFAAPILGLLKTSTPEVCYNELGCFRNDGLFSSSSFRPISCVPQSPQVIGTEFLIYSRQNPDNPQVIEAIDSHLFDSIDFNPNLNTKFIIHGYKEGLLIQGFSHDTFELIKDGILYNEDSNVILVRWNRGASGFYFQAVANCRVVGAQIALLVNHLINQRDGRPERFHLIGFSLGSHISGYAGKRINNLGRITGLDPAKPYFDGVPQLVRLDSTDALIVDALHTDNGIGTRNTLGHIDIYFNSGDLQPGCERQILDTILNDGPLDGFFEIISCDHKRALHYYADFLLNQRSKCIPIAYRCESWDRYISGHCSSCGESGENCAVVGLNTGLSFNQNLLRKAHNKYFLMTSDRQPFCVYQYLVQISTHPTKARIEGNFHLRFYSLNNTYTDHKSRHLELKSENKASFVISNGIPLEEIRKIDLIFSKQMNSSDQQNIVYINSMQLMPLNMIDDNEKLRNSVNFCTFGMEWLANRDEQSMISLQNRHCI